jgi:hypothetical protein
MYPTARFNAFRSFLDWNNSEGMASAREEAVQYFVDQYQLMLEENLENNAALLFVEIYGSNGLVPMSQEDLEPALFFTPK